MGALLCQRHTEELMAERLENPWLSILYQLDARLKVSGVGKEGTSRSASVLSEYTP
jgi:hypothetical protein